MSKNGMINKLVSGCVAAAAACTLYYSYSQEKYAVHSLLKEESAAYSSTQYIEGTTYDRFMLKSDGKLYDVRSVLSETNTGIEEDKDCKT